MKVHTLPVWAWILTMGMFARADEKPDILLIAVDDLNDWIGCMGGHPQVKTPHIDRLAARGVLFDNAHCQSPVCNPSRVSLMTGLYPETTGIYFLNPPIAGSKIASKSVTMPKRFERENYAVAAAGKLFHSRDNKKFITNWAGMMGGFGPYPKKKLSPFPGHPLWDWGAFPERDDQMPDHKIASWATRELARERSKPAWLGVGFMTTHVPQYTPQKWLNLYPLETVQLPKIDPNDLDDLSDYAIDLTRKKHVAPTHEWVTENREWKNLVRTYLACVSFVDHQVGRVLDALDASPRAENTVVVLFSDHGFHLGEKERWAKRSVWQDGSGVPLIIAGPGIAKGKVCKKPVELLDIYPTLLDLAGLDSDAKLEGQSLVPLLKNPRATWPHYARSSFGPGNVAIVSETHRYVRYRDGSEELYNRKADPHEWKNLADRPELEQTLARHRKHLPTKFHAILGQGSTGHRALQAAEQGRQTSGSPRSREKSQ